jgi:hypothetical protein
VFNKNSNWCGRGKGMYAFVVRFYRFFLVTYFFFYYIWRKERKIVKKEAY